MTKPQWRDAAKEKFWRRMVRQWRQSGSSVRAFCDQQELSEASFYGWRRILAQRDQEAAQATTKSAAKAAPQARCGPGDSVAEAALPAFVQVDVAAERPLPGVVVAVPDGIELVVGGGRVVRVRRGFDAALLRQVLRVLEEPAC